MSILVFPKLPSGELIAGLNACGFSWVGCDPSDEIEDALPAPAIGVVIEIDGETADGWVGIDSVANLKLPILYVVDGERLAALRHVEQVDDFCLKPLRQDEFETRLRRLIGSSNPSDGSLAASDPNQIIFGPLVLNIESYQATVSGKMLDLTYMEYELLKYLVSRPGKVCSRADLLSEVWGYEYHGGARTVDVHIRRLRSKLGEEHASLITTLRSVGYVMGAAN